MQALELNVNQNLKLANDWFTANKLTLNVGKTKVLLFSHRIVTEPTNFTINNKNQTSRRGLQRKIY